jgi:UDP-N-acetylmuramoyl-L-alanyl-D-glutamate--2,6-diaminopimelate ligase
MKLLKEIIYKAGIESVTGSTEIPVSMVTFYSAKVIDSSLFIAVKGTNTDGHKFINDAIEKGAKSVICETLPEKLRENVTYVKVKDSTLALAQIAVNYYNNPSEKIKLIGITGTNGKTTIATLLFELFRKLGYKTGLLSTVKNQINDQVIPSTHTTPDALQLNALLSTMLDEDCTYCFMEISSHAIAQKRTAGISFAGGVFTNITHEHLDYHKTFENYLKAKQTFFTQLPSDAFAITNADDKNGLVMIQNSNAHKYSYGLKTMADFKCKLLESSFSGIILNIDGHEAMFRLLGTFNAYNLTAVYATAVLLNQEKLEVLTALSNMTPVEGRFEYIKSENNITGIVDYAHTPDALQNVLQTINDIRTGNESVITIVGCGGDRDTSKRPVMAQIATDMSDKVILTSDNPRSESADLIIQEMEKGISPGNKMKYLSIQNRKEAIKAACSMAKPGDIILVAGKGHEKYQEIKGVKYPFDDKEILVSVFELINNQ